MGLSLLLGELGRSGNSFLPLFAGTSRITVEECLWGELAMRESEDRSVSPERPLHSQEH